MKKVIRTINEEEKDKNRKDTSLSDWKGEKRGSEGVHPRVFVGPVQKSVYKRIQTERPETGGRKKATANATANKS